eukprot:SAG22_NODE_5196_length_1064_cov_0.909845_1_plen_46_part_00
MSGSRSSSSSSSSSSSGEERLDHHFDMALRRLGRDRNLRSVIAKP